MDPSVTAERSRVIFDRAILVCRSGEEGGVAMKGHVRRRGTGWVYVVDVDGGWPARRCETCGERRWMQARKPAGRCPCGGALGAEVRERRQVWSTIYRTKREVEEALRVFLHVLATGDDPFPSDITLGRLLAASLFGGGSAWLCGGVSVFLFGEESVGPVPEFAAEFVVGDEVVGVVVGEGVREVVEDFGEFDGFENVEGGTGVGWVHGGFILG